jgi:hypothetical protein
MLSPGNGNVAAKPLQTPPEVGVSAESRLMPCARGLDLQFQIGTIRFGLPWLRSIPLAPGRQWVLRLVAADENVTIGTEPPELRLPPVRPKPPRQPAAPDCK